MTKDLIETIEAIEKHDEDGKLLNTLQTIANLMNEPSRRTGATYERIVKCHRLTIKINYGEHHGDEG